MVFSSISATFNTVLKLLPQAKTHWALEILCAFEGLRAASGYNTCTQALLQEHPTG